METKLKPNQGENGKYGFIYQTGKEVIPFQYDAAGHFSEGLAPVQLSGKWGFIDPTGKEIIPFKVRWCRRIYQRVGRGNY